MALPGKIVLLETDKFGFEYRSTDYNKPVRFRQIWPIETITMKRMSYCEPNDAMGREATITDGLASCYLGNGNWFYGKLPQGGSTPHILFEETPMPCPKVRKGIETRWHQGAWQKQLRNGWVPA